MKKSKKNISKKGFSPDKEDSTKEWKKEKKSSRGRGDYSAEAKHSENMKHEAYGNDISWYVNDSQLLNDACNLTFSNALSDTMPVGTYGGFTGNPKTYLPSPGVMCLSVVPSIGHVLRDPDQYRTGDMWDSAVNMAARAEWAYIRQKNAGAKNYDAPDLMMYHLAMDNIYMYWSWMVRIYGYMRLYAFKNKYYPYGILRAMGLTDAAIEDLRGNLANFRTYINLYAAQMSSFAVPTTLPYVKRHLWLFQNTFMDASTSKAQVYMYNPELLFRLCEVQEAPMSLIVTDMPKFPEEDVRDGYALEKIKAVGDKMLAPVVKSESCVIMSGDILKAYDTSNIYAFQSIPDDFSLMPVYDEIVLSQIHNSNVIHSTGRHDESRPQACVIKQDPNIDAGYIYQVYESDVSGYDAVVLDSKYESPTPTDVMYSTRLTCVRNTDKPYYYDTGSEFIVGVVIYTSARDEKEHIVFGRSERYAEHYDLLLQVDPASKVNGIQVMNFVKFITALSKFDWHPIMFTNFNRGNSGLFEIKDVHELIGDVDNFAIVRAMTISKMHKVALNSEFGLPYLLTSIK